MVRRESGDRDAYWRDRVQDGEGPAPSGSGSSKGWSDDGDIIDEDGVRGYGHLRASKTKRPGEIDSSRLSAAWRLLMIGTFFGTSHFGPQLAAKVIHVRSTLVAVLMIGRAFRSA